MYNFFAYGTLQIPEVIFAVTRQVFIAQTARLDHYARHRLRGKSFPGIRPAPGASVEGTLILGVDGETLQNLDEFEDDFYRREPVRVTTADGKEWEAHTYVLKEESFDLLLPEDWRLEEFGHRQIAKFLLMHE
jgi:gamma-glutamylcyclotransferase (GGCT)/AIG2-like uncharacterized protein YtfP